MLCSAKFDKKSLCITFLLIPMLGKSGCILFLMKFQTASVRTFGAFPLHGTVRFGTARYGTVRLSSGRFAFPLQFSTAIEWVGLFTRRYNCAASTAVTSS